MLTDAHTASVSFSFRMFILFTTSNPKALFFYHNVISPDLNVPLNVSILFLYTEFLA